MARRTKEEAEGTRQLLMKTALRLFSDQGIQTTTLAAVAKEAGVTRGAIYWHFKDKSEMLEALWDKIMQPMELVYEKLRGDVSGDPLLVLEQIAESFFLLAASNEDFQQVLKITMQSQSDPLLAERCQQLCREEMDSLSSLMTQARDKGFLRTDLSVKAASLTYYGFIEGVAGNWLNSGCDPLLIEEARPIARVLIQGLRKAVN
ncbi:MAG: TetR family transcriptional regulator [Endozoicomonas sp.]